MAGSGYTCAELKAKVDTFDAEIATLAAQPQSVRKDGVAVDNGTRMQLLREERDRWYNLWQRQCVTPPLFSKSRF